MGKGSKQRPLSVSHKQFEENWLRTFGRKPTERDLEIENDSRYKDWRSAYESDKRRGKGYRGK